MSYHLKQRESIIDAVRRIAVEQIDKATAEITDRQLDHHRAVHHFRKRAKKFRGLVRLVRPALGDVYQHENRWFRDAARRFSHVRDAHVLVKTAELLRVQADDSRDREILEDVEKHLEERREYLTEKSLGVVQALRELGEQLPSARDRISDWTVTDESFDCIAGGIKKTYRRGLKACRKANRRNSNERLHEWRKRTKYHWYHMRLLRDVWTPVLTARLQAADRLSDLLGDDHDLAVFRTTLLKEPTRYGTPEEIERLMVLMQRRRTKLQSQACSLGDRLYADHPSELVHRLKCYWSTWRNDRSIDAGPRRQ